MLTRRTEGHLTSDRGSRCSCPDRSSRSHRRQSRSSGTGRNSARCRGRGNQCFWPENKTDEKPLVTSKLKWLPTKVAVNPVIVNTAKILLGRQIIKTIMLITTITRALCGPRKRWQRVFAKIHSALHASLVPSPQRS